jgi:hypothetical protein
MANLGTTFDASTVDPSTTYEILPPGQYVVQIVQSEMRPTKSGTGQQLVLELDVLEGPQAGRKLFDRLNLVNPNTQAVEIAQRTLSAICHATGRMQVQDSEELHLVPMLADVTVQPPKNGYGESNRIRYRPLERAAQPAPQPVQPTAQPQPAPQAQPTAQPASPARGFANAPWKRAG